MLWTHATVDLSLDPIEASFAGTYLYFPCCDERCYTELRGTVGHVTCRKRQAPRGSWRDGSLRKACPCLSDSLVRVKGDDGIHRTSTATVQRTKDAQEEATREQRCVSVSFLFVLAQDCVKRL